MKRERQVKAAAQELTRSGLNVELTATSGPGSATELARQAAEAGCTLVLACGGDGTINEVANGLAGTDTALGILPGGTANILAKELGVPHDPVAAARQFESWRPRRIPLGRATWKSATPGGEERRYFVCVAGIGFDAYILHKLQRSRAMAFGVAAYGWEALRQLFRYSFPRFVAQMNGHEFRAAFATIQRTSRYAGWVRMAPRRDFFALGLTVCLFKSSSRRRYPAYAWAVMRGRHAHLRDVEEIEATRVHLSAEDRHPHIYFELDGELAGCLPVTLEAVRDALTLLVPMP